ncbi:MAG: UvrD-helicase domain-containing protein, partial [Treponema sp.]|nr:UvrD-helicase domain-containing protein [Treponema sp.]
MEPEKKPALNKEQQAAVYCEKNSVIAAGAGAGKTLVLAKRFVWLITEKKYAVNEILTLTFTKKAATEMYRRIYLELSETASDCSGEKGKLAQKAIDEFAQARIQTLDSYSTAIVKQAANRYGISPDFSVDDERCRQLAIEEALPFVIARRSHPAIECLYHHKNPVYIANEIFAKALYNYSYIDSPPDVEHDINIQFNIICNEWKKYRKIIIDKIDEISIICRENEKLHPDIAPILHQFNKGNVAFPDEQELRNFFKQLMDIPEKNKVSWANAHSLQKAMEDTLVFFASLKDLNLNKGPKKNNPVKDFVINFRKIFNEFSSLAVYCKQAGLIYSMLILLSDLQKQYLEKKRSLGILTFSDIARLSKKILLEQHDIRYNEKETFKAIMIDEFQDNNEMQK